MRVDVERGENESLATRQVPVIFMAAKEGEKEGESSEEGAEAGEEGAASEEVGGEQDDDEEEDEEGAPAASISLGFAEKPPHPAALSRLYFPSKLGGLPAWLDPLRLPTGDATRCSVCGDPLAFVLQVGMAAASFFLSRCHRRRPAPWQRSAGSDALLKCGNNSFRILLCSLFRVYDVNRRQVYAPLDSPDAFHRTLFLFSCRKGACAVSPGGLRAFRGQVIDRWPSSPPHSMVAMMSAVTRAAAHACLRARL